MQLWDVLPDQTEFHGLIFAGIRAAPQCSEKLASCKGGSCKKAHNRDAGHSAEVRATQRSCHCVHMPRSEFAHFPFKPTYTRVCGIWFVDLDCKARALVPLKAALERLSELTRVSSLLRIIPRMAFNSMGQNPTCRIKSLYEMFNDLQSSPAPAPSKARRQPVCLLLGGGMAAGKSTVREIIGNDSFWTKVRVLWNSEFNSGIRAVAGVPCRRASSGT